MIVKDGSLDTEEFKKFFPNITWIKAPRKLGLDHKEFFYLGSFEDDKKIIKISIRPSMRMSITESYKNHTEQGKLAPKDFKGKTCNWGYSTTVLIDESFKKKIESIAQVKPPTIEQKLSWD